jgi:hypothetical protein
MTNKQFAEQAGLYYEDSISDENYDIAIQDFAQLVRDDERAKCAADYLQDCCDAIDAARLEGIKACVELLDDFSKTQMVPAKDTWRMGVVAAANAVRDKK